MTVPSARRTAAADVTSFEIDESLKKYIDEYNCTGKPEPLRGNLEGYWSVHIDDKNRIVFRIENGSLEIMQCGSHYGDK